MKRRLKKIFTSHLKRSFDAVLFAQDEPIIKGAKNELRGFLKELGV